MKVTCPKCKRRIRIKKSDVLHCQKCGYDEHYANFKKMGKIYLVDANIIINAINRNPRWGSDCQEVLLRSDIATTEQVVSEIGKHDKIPYRVFKVGKISADLKELKANSFKQPSENDLSLVQAAIDNPDVVGIITYDNDFFMIAAKGIVLSRSSKPLGFWVGTAKDFLKKVQK